MVLFLVGVFLGLHLHIDLDSKLDSKLDSHFGLNFAQARDQILQKKTKVYSNLCDTQSDYYKKTGQTCGVKTVQATNIDYSSQDGSDPYPYLGSVAYTGFEAFSWQDLTEYGFVQYIRGCTFESEKKRDGTIERRIGESIWHFDVRRVFTFPTWSFDANTTDPLYFGPLEEDSHLPGGRLALYRWTPDLSITEGKATKDLYKMLKLPKKDLENYRPAVFVVDTPSMGTMREHKIQKSSTRVFQSVALEFKICLYHLKDIPLKVEKDYFLPATPIVCHDWDSQFEFNFATNSFEHKPGKGLDKYCAASIPHPPGRPPNSAKAKKKT